MLRLFKKPDLEPKYEKENLEKEIQDLQIRYEKLYAELEQKRAEMQVSFKDEVILNTREIEALERTLATKRQERKLLEAPLDDRKAELEKRGVELDFKAKEIIEKEQNILAEQLSLKRQKESIEDMADEMGEKRMLLDKREFQIIPKEIILKQKEDDYISMVKTRNGLLEKRESEIREKAEKLKTVVVTLQAKEENLEQREEKIKEDLKLIESKRQALLLAQKTC